MGKVQENARRIDEYQKRLDKQRQLDELREKNAYLIKQRKETVSNYYLEPNTTPMGILLYMVETLLGRKGSGYEWFINIVIFFLAMALESWAFIGAIILRGGDYMAEMEMQRLKREDDRMRRANLAQKMRKKTQEMDDAIMNDGKSVAEIRRDLVLTALKKEYTLISNKEVQTPQDRQRLQDILSELEEIDELPTGGFSYQSEDDALKDTLHELKGKKPDSEDDMPPEFSYAT